MVPHGLELMVPQGAHGPIIGVMIVELYDQYSLVVIMVWSSWHHHIDNDLELQNQYPLVSTMVWSSWRHHIDNDVEL